VTRIIFVRMNPAQHGAPRSIDITPGVRWRHALKILGVVLFLLVAVPLVWFVGALALITLAGIGAIAFAIVAVRMWWAGLRLRR
jgi:hypothetical protein